MARLPSGTVTLVFSDIEGSTKLLRRLGPAYAPALDEHRMLVRTAFAASGGVEVETRGDSFLFAFGSAHAAVRAAVDAHRALATHTWPEGGVVRVRIGVHTGEPQLTADGYVGLDVHRAARIGDAGHGGQIVLSDATRALVGGEFALRELGEYRLAGLERPERLYDLAGADFPPLRTERQQPRRRERRRRPTDVGWHVHALGHDALAGSVLAAIRLLRDAERILETVDRDALAARAADHARRAAVAPHVALAAGELAAQLAALDRLPERRRAVEDAIADLDARIDGLAADEVDDERARLSAVAQSLEQTIAAAPSPPQIPVGKLRRTRRRAIYRVGGTFVVLERGEHGVKLRHTADTIDEALLLRESLRAARRGPHLGYLPRTMWEDKSRKYW
jgi:class 3 adenylate cyclase